MLDFSELAAKTLYTSQQTKSFQSYWRASQRQFVALSQKNKKVTITFIPKKCTAVALHKKS